MQFMRYVSGLKHKLHFAEPSTTTAHTVPFGVPSNGVQADHKCVSTSPGQNNQPPRGLLTSNSPYANSHNKRGKLEEVPHHIQRLLDE